MAVLAQHIETFWWQCLLRSPQRLYSKHCQSSYGIWKRAIFYEFNFDGSYSLIDEQWFICMMGEGRHVPFALIAGQWCRSFIDGFDGGQIRWHQVEQGSLRRS